MHRLCIRPIVKRYLCMYYAVTIMAGNTVEPEISWVFGLAIVRLLSKENVKKVTRHSK